MPELNLLAHLLGFSQATQLDQLRRRFLEIDQQLDETLRQATWWKPRGLDRDSIWTPELMSVEPVCNRPR